MLRKTLMIALLSTAWLGSGVAGMALGNGTLRNKYPDLYCDAAWASHNLFSDVILAVGGPVALIGTAMAVAAISPSYASFSLDYTAGQIPEGEDYCLETKYGDKDY